MNKTEYFRTLSKIVTSLKKAQNLAIDATEIGIKNISQPGIIKEVIMAHDLKHRVHATKKEHDAESFNDPSRKYEYLSCLEGKSFQFDRVNILNLRNRVLRRNTKIFCGVFDKNRPLNLLRIYSVNPKSIWRKLNKKYNASSVTSRHVGITETELLRIKKKRLVYS